VIGGPGFTVSDTSCFSGQYAFGTYLCGSTLGSCNLYIPDDDVTLLDSVSFDVGGASSLQSTASAAPTRANSRSPEVLHPAMSADRAGQRPISSFGTCCAFAHSTLKS